MKNISIFLLALCAYTSVNSQITLTKDISYGNNGTVSFIENSSWNRHFFTSDNRLIVCQNGDWSNISKFALYSNNGSLLTTISTPNQSGDISVVFADANNIFPVDNGFLYKYSNTGALDTTFGNNGQLFIGSNYTATNYSTAAFLSDGKILVRNQDNFTRYNADGMLDTSYGNNGIMNILAPSSSHPYFNEKIDNNYFFENSNGRRKININTGNLDLNYGNNGYSVNSNQTVYIPSDPEAMINDFEIITLLYRSGSGFSYAISKTKSDGNIDNSFGNSGILDLPEIFNNKVLFYGLAMKIDDFNNKIFLPLNIRTQQGSDTDSKIGISSYSISSGSAVNINGSAVFDTGFSGGNNISIEIIGNYLYLFAQTSVTRYILNESTLEIQDLHETNEIGFNNPFSNELNFNSNEKIKQVEVLDENGRLIIKEKNKNKINTSTLNKGVYIIKITTDSDKIISKKAIKN